jgi:hypothetical protein
VEYGSSHANSIVPRNRVGAQQALKNPKVNNKPNEDLHKTLKRSKKLPKLANFHKLSNLAKNQFHAAKPQKHLPCAVLNFGSLCEFIVENENMMKINPCHALSLIMLYCPNA